MSKNNHHNAQEITYIVSEINRLTEEEVKQLYGIEILNNNKVFDPTYNKMFESVGEWATFNVEQDNVEYEECFHDNDYYDGEY